MKKLNQLQIAFIFLGLFTLISCDNSDPKPVNEEELITTVEVTFTPTNGGAPVVARFRDLDGAGGQDPEKQDPTLSVNTTYTVSVRFLNETESPAEDITVEVQEEAEDHQVFFEISNNLNLTYSYEDSDSNGNPLGLSGTVITTSSSFGTLGVILVHEPNKSAEGVSEGEITNAGGEEDVRVTFLVNIQ